MKRWLVLMMICLVAVHARGAESPELTVLSAAGLTEVMTELQSRFQSDQTCRVHLSLDASSTLARQIESGAPADIFVSADTEWMRYLDERHLLEPRSERMLASNQLAIVVPADSRMILSHPVERLVATDLPGPGSMPDPSHVPAGRYAREALTALHVWDGLQPRLVLAQSVRAGLRFVETGDAAWGVVYATDARASSRVRVLAGIPSHLHRPIVISAAVVHRPRAGPTDALAWRFMDAMSGSQAADIFARRGFLPPPTTVSRPAAPPAYLAGSESSIAVGPIIALSLRVAGASLAILSIPGLALGWVLARRRFPGKSILDAAICAPLVMPPVLTGYLLLTFLGRNSSVGRWLSTYAGVNLSFTWLGAALAAAIMGLPLLVRSVRIAIEMIDRRLEHSAATLGAGPLRTWFTITLPLAMPGVAAGFVLAFARSLGEFGATITFAGNVEGQTRTLPLAIYSLMQQPGGDGAVRRLAIVSLVLSFGALIASEAFVRRLQRARGVMAP